MEWVFIFNGKEESKIGMNENKILTIGEVSTTAETIYKNTALLAKLKIGSIKNEERPDVHLVQKYKKDIIFKITTDQFEDVWPIHDFPHVVMRQNNEEINLIEASMSTESSISVMCEVWGVTNKANFTWLLNGENINDIVYKTDIFVPTTTTITTQLPPTTTITADFYHMSQSINLRIQASFSTLQCIVNDINLQVMFL